MTIEHVHFNKPWKVSLVSDFDLQVKREIAKGECIRKRLIEGEYPITHLPPENNTYEHSVVVFDNGNGLYRMKPKDSEVGFFVFEEEVVYKQGGKTVAIPQDSESVAIIAHVEEGVLGVYDVFMHHSGISPRFSKRLREPIRTRKKRK